MKMKRYKIISLLLLIGFGFSACKGLNQTPTSASGETTISAMEADQNKPLKINSNTNYVKHRKVNRRMIHRIHRLHRA